MLEILSVQVVAAIIGMAGIGAADWLYYHQRIGQLLHSLWVAALSTAIPLPVLIWTANLYLGSGMLSYGVIGSLGAMMFLWMYRNLRKVPSLQRVEAEPLAPRASRRPIPPSSNNG